MSRTWHVSLTKVAERWKCSEEQARALVQREDIGTLTGSAGGVYVDPAWVEHWARKLVRRDVRASVFGDAPAPAATAGGVGTVVNGDSIDSDFLGKEQYD